MSLAPRRPSGLASRGAVCGALVVAIVAGATACEGGRSRRPTPRTEPPPAPPDAPADRPFDEGSKATRERVDAAIAALSRVDGSAFADVVRVLVAAGDASVPPLLETLASGEPRARARAAYVLGFLQDRRTLPALAAAAADDPDATVRSDAGASLLELGDPRGFAPLVDALDDPDARRRVRAIDALAAATGGTRLGYEPDGPPAERAAAVVRWRDFLARKRAELEEGDAVPSDVPAPDEMPPTDEVPAPAMGDAPTGGSRPTRDGRDQRPKRP
ncbi:MAG: HEAT repeat domain-containing protein [Planctomycetia bacterium]|nr:HEAT repeat domain-containing protein [Planctomycetia bacterium]